MTCQCSVCKGTLLHGETFAFQAAKKIAEDIRTTTEGYVGKPNNEDTQKAIQHQVNKLLEQ